MLYDIVMIALIVASASGAIWASRQMSKAAKEGKLHVIGIVTKENRDTWKAGKTYTCPSCGEEYAVGVKCDLCN
jgi:hypothetical protein